jgi:hypothetical protein
MTGVFRVVDQLINGLVSNELVEQGESPFPAGLGKESPVRVLPTNYTGAAAPKETCGTRPPISPWCK